MADPVIPADSYLLLLTSLYCRPVTIRETKRIKRNSPGHRCCGCLGGYFSISEF